MLVPCSPSARPVKGLAQGRSRTSIGPPSRRGLGKQVLGQARSEGWIQTVPGQRLRIHTSVLVHLRRVFFRHPLVYDHALVNG